MRGGFVSRSLRCLFVHIPKAAGTSLKGFLESHDTPSPNPDAHLRFDSGDPAVFEPPPPHLRAVDYVRCGIVSQSEFDSFFKFSFVRNPWDRLVSEYKFRRHPVSIDFKTFLFERFPRRGWTDEYCHVIPQYDFVHDSSGNLLVDFVGKFENLEDDFAHVCDVLHIEHAKRLAHANQSQALHLPDDMLSTARLIKDMLSLRRRRHIFPHYTDYYDDESRALVARLYAKDIETFGYAFG